MRAVVVTPQLDWRLHAFDLLCEASGPPLGSSEPWPLAAGAFAVGAQYKAAEVPAHRGGLVLFRMDGITHPNFPKSRSQAWLRALRPQVCSKLASEEDCTALALYSGLATVSSAVAMHFGQG